MNHEVIERGRKAQSLLNDENFQFALQSLQTNAMKAWASTQPSQSQEREQFYYLMLALGHVEAQLRGWIDDAKMEARKEDQTNK